MSKVIVPIISEKAYSQSEKLNTYMFKVPMGLNKLQIAEEISKKYDVTVTGVRVLVQNGKKARSIRLKKRAARVVGKRPDEKKAYVTLAKGSSIPIFASEVDGEDK